MAIELFPNIPQDVRDRTKLIADFALMQNDAISAVKILSEYANTCINEEEQEFVDFYFNMRFEQLKENL